MIATHAVGHVFPSKNLPFGQEVHSEFEGPLHSAQSPWQGSHVFVPVFGYIVEGQPFKQLVPSKLEGNAQLRQLLFDGPLHVSHSAWQVSQELVVVFSYTFVATQAAGQAVPSKYLPFGHEEH